MIKRYVSTNLFIKNLQWPKEKLKQIKHQRLRSYTVEPGGKPSPIYKFTMGRKILPTVMLFA